MERKSAKRGWSHDSQQVHRSALSPSSERQRERERQPSSRPASHSVTPSAFTTRPPRRPRSRPPDDEADDHVRLPRSPQYICFVIGRRHSRASLTLTLTEGLPHPPPQCLSLTKQPPSATLNHNSLVPNELKRIVIRGPSYSAAASTVSQTPSQPDDSHLAPIPSRQSSSHLTGDGSTVTFSH